MRDAVRPRLRTFIFILALTVCLSLQACAVAPRTATEDVPPLSDHFDGTGYFNGDLPRTQPPSADLAQLFSRTRRIVSWTFGGSWPDVEEQQPGPPPAASVPKGALSITPVGHATFLVQMDGLNILIDPIWSDRCGPAPWIGLSRRQAPGILFDDLPSIDAVLVTHNHYDHLDLPTLNRLAARGTMRAVTMRGNAGLIEEAGIAAVDALDWWQSVALSEDVTVTAVPAQHFSSRTLWDRNETLWGGFVITGPSGKVFHAGDTGYGPHFKKIAKRFPSIRAALLPIAPFQPPQPNDPSRGPFSSVHMGPDDAVAAHIDLGAQVSIAAHFQVFELGHDGFDEAVNGLAEALQKQGLSEDSFITPVFGHAIALPPEDTAICGPDSPGYPRVGQ